MAAIRINPHWLGVTNTNVRRMMADAASRGACFGGYDTSIWRVLTATLSGPYKVLYNSACDVVLPL